ncbi:TIGR03086 family metal-binding protein [Streptomyces sp. NPDC048172]|uniref:TIGR03086 family metal-binding protein n=1 Tax=Streptomyces sp. NPDC048172 TaxID=3365505 RepID=UPI00370F905D
MSEQMYENGLICMREAAVEAARLARGAEGAPLEAPSPCADWDLRALLQHWILYTAHGLERRARREELPAELTARDFPSEPGWAASYARQLDRAVAAWEKPDAWQGEIDLGHMSVPAADIAGMVVKEMAVHGWDVATTTGQEVQVSDRLGAFVLGVVERHAEIYRQYDGFADPCPVPEGASDFVRALALSGRRAA